MNKKILVFKQPFPCGNYKLNEEVAKRLKSEGHDVYLIQQLHGQESDEEYEQQLKELEPDIVYFEMLDANTFNLMERLFKNATKILCFTSGGILNKPEDILDKYGTWYDAIMTNSIKFKDMFKAKRIPTQYFEFYHSVIYEDEDAHDANYMHDCVFLGMGFNRLTSPDYTLERNLFFNCKRSEVDFNIYGRGWGDKMDTYKGLLPPDDIGKLYYNSTTAVGIIAKGQRELGMINNRYTEIGMSLTSIISPKYGDFDWHGLDQHINFVASKSEFIETVQDEKHKWDYNYDIYMDDTHELQKFFITHDKIFFEKLNILIDEI